MSYEYIPAELKQLRQWVNWRTEERGGKQTKVPLIAEVGTGRRRYAKSNDPATWRSYDEARQCARHKRGTHGIGFMLGSGYFGIDLDHILRADMQPAAQEILSHFLGAYVERSPSGNGLHIMACGVVGAGRKVTLAGGKAAIEIYDHGRFFTVTGDAPAPRAVQTPLPNCQAGIDWLVKTYMNPTTKNIVFSHFKPGSAEKPGDKCDKCATPGGEYEGNDQGCGDSRGVMRGNKQEFEVNADNGEVNDQEWRLLDIQLRHNPQPPARKLALIQHIEPRWQITWDEKIHPGDSSQSGHDMALTRLMARNGWSPQEMCDTLRVFRGHHGKLDKEGRLDYFQRTIWKILQDVHSDAEGPPAREKPDVALIKHLTSLDIQRYIQTGMAPAHYRVVLASGTVVQVGNAAQARTQGTWQTIAQEHLGEPFKKLSATHWQQFLHCLAAIVEREEPHGSSHLQTMREHLLVYSYQSVSVSGYEVISVGRPFSSAEDGYFYVSLNHLGGWLRRQGVVMDDSALLSTLKVLGAEPKQIFRSSETRQKSRMRRRYWRLPLPSGDVDLEAPALAEPEGSFQN